VQSLLLVFIGLPENADPELQLVPTCREIKITIEDFFLLLPRGIAGDTTYNHGVSI
jgi:hypothetical protein